MTHVQFFLEHVFLLKAVIFKTYYWLTNTELMAPDTLACTETKPKVKVFQWVQQGLLTLGNTNSVLTPSVKSFATVKSLRKHHKYVKGGALNRPSKARLLTDLRLCRLTWENTHFQRVGFLATLGRVAGDHTCSTGTWAPPSVFTSNLQICNPWRPRSGVSQWDSICS